MILESAYVDGGAGHLVTWIPGQLVDVDGIWTIKL